MLDLSDLSNLLIVRFVKFVTQLCTPAVSELNKEKITTQECSY